jgi:hypothetical protein
MRLRSDDGGRARPLLQNVLESRENTIYPSIRGKLNLKDKTHLFNNLALKEAASIWCWPASAQFRSYFGELRAMNT